VRSTFAGNYSCQPALMGYFSGSIRDGNVKS